MDFDLSIFKAYDVRGLYPSQINEDFCFAIGQAYAKVIQPKKVAIGRDVRVHGGILKEKLIKGLTDAGVDVIDIGVISTEMLYYAVGNFGYDGGLTVSASHNPAEFNGVKMVGKDSRAISADTGLFNIRDKMGEKFIDENKGKVEEKNILDEYIKYILDLAKLKNIQPCKIVANPNFGQNGIALLRLIGNAQRGRCAKGTFHF
ncbi:MAG: phosphomannomutase [Candidatus Berkelbacteria bacterium Licking1014_85]|uniref:Phosphomannomutase n=1 Tax=Candidatus Berkelbacteria bacterium Licking1014_85 TaxID=2017148 RepID=A0A554LKZ2_9BACT|nr:MAG: phosphomannomutase [Candidatus Berkelbacteria bacterium Licking1014_85]